MGKDAWIWKTTAAIAGAALFLSACSGQGERMTSKAMREQEIEKQEKEVFLAGQTKESPKKTEKAEPGERSEPSERSESSEKSRGRIGENLGMDPLFLDETYLYGRGCECDSDRLSGLSIRGRRVCSR